MMDYFSELINLCCRSSNLKLYNCGNNTYRVTRHSYLNAIAMVRNALSRNLVIRDITLRKKEAPGPWYSLKIEICKTTKVDEPSSKSSKVFISRYHGRKSRKNIKFN